MKKRSHREFRKNFFTVRITDEWNSLPDSVKEARNVTCFKRLYRRHTAGTVAPAAAQIKGKLKNKSLKINEFFVVRRVR